MKTIRGYRVDQEGIFNRDMKMNVLTTIGTDLNDPMRWIENWTGEGTALKRFVLFVRRVCADLAQRYPGRPFC